MSVDLNEHLSHWLTNTPPPSDDPEKYDHLVTLSFRESTKERVKTHYLEGQIGWDQTIQKFYFQKMKWDSATGQYTEHLATYSAVICLAIRATILYQYGVSIVRGIRDGDIALKMVSPSTNKAKP